MYLLYVHYTIFFVQLATITEIFVLFFILSVSRRTTYFFPQHINFIYYSQNMSSPYIDKTIRESTHFSVDNVYNFVYK